MKLIVSPYSNALRSQHKWVPHPKNYPFWDDLLELMRERFDVIEQIGLKDEKPLARVTSTVFDNNLLQIKQRLLEADYWIAVDNMTPHLAWLYHKPGAVIFGVSDPEIFGHPENCNILKGREYLRPEQYGIWEVCEPRLDAWEFPHKIWTQVKGHLKILGKE